MTEASGSGRRIGVRVALLAALAGTSVAMANPVEVEVPIPGGVTRMRLETPDAATSQAAQLGAFGPGFAEQFVYTATSRVLVETDNPAEVRRTLAGQAATMNDASIATLATRDAEGAPGVVVIEAGTVVRAAALARRLEALGQFASVQLDTERPRSLRMLPGDPSFPNQWHLRNTQVTLADINAEDAWNAGYTGEGVIVGIVEDGFQSSHPDLSSNYVSAASQSGGFSTSHATGCAGIAAADNNTRGGVGVAYDAGISQQLLGSDSQNASAFGYRNDIVGVKSNSWGPFDNGNYWYMSATERNALENAALNGRGGLGTITCWAAGNGGTGDRVDYDPYASSRFTFAIGSVGDLDTRAWYNELGSSMLVVTHSSGNNRGTYTTTTTSSYTSNFGGTSSASPLAAGAVALALQANPAMTWRDMMHVLIESARKVDPNDEGWSTNAAGYDISYDYGFGAIDAGELVATAAGWTNVGPEVSDQSGVMTLDLSIPDNSSSGVEVTIPIAENIVIESVELVVNIDHNRRGDLEIVLTSPEGTDSIFASPRSETGDDLVDYVFTSHRPFGELSQGDWTLHVADRSSGWLGTLEDAEVRVYGTAAVVACSPADLSGDGILNNTDINAFVSAFTAQDPSADMNGDGNFNNTDINTFVTLFLAGC